MIPFSVKVNMDADDVFCGRLIKDLGKAADKIRSAETVKVVTHIDADGISSGGIASTALERLGKEFTITFEKKITEDTISA
ncbi:MAG: hypothetical protein LBR42_01790, partial [Candidatus Methanoplasma sp.]|nr:hypothetical protein [Candidatus Methanoplasma sp.]